MSLRHTPSGRLRKALPTHKRQPYRPSFQANEDSPATFRRATQEYPSAIDWKTETLELSSDTSYRQEVSSQYTIAPAYNKGAYQVISRTNVEDIGR
jgi:hypothetical protein